MPILASRERKAQLKSLNKSVWLFLCIFSFILAFNISVLKTYFIIDDTANIFCSKFSVLDILFDRNTYLYFNKFFFTPLLPILFKLDWILFKLNPLGYHLSNCVIASLCILAYFRLISSYMRPLFAFLAAFLLCVSLPISFDIAWITRKHYLCGFLFSLISLLFLQKWNRFSRHTMLIISLATSLLAYLCKEAYAILPFLTFFFVEGSLLKRVKVVLLFILVFFGYLIWRMLILGGFGGYPGLHKSIYSFALVPEILLDLSLSHYGYFVIILIINLFMIYIRKVRMFFMLIVLLTLSILPFVFFPGKGFSLANKTLIFVAICSFVFLYPFELFQMHKSLIRSYFLIFLLPLVIMEVSNSIAAQRRVMTLAANYQLAASQIPLGKGTRKNLLIISNYAYYFSNLYYIYRELLNIPTNDILAISNVLSTPYLPKQVFDRIIKTTGLSLEFQPGQRQNVKVLAAGKARAFFKKLKQEILKRTRLDKPRVQFDRVDKNLKILISDKRPGVFYRCLYMQNYVGCYPIPKVYQLFLSSVKKVDKIDLILEQTDGKLSFPATWPSFTQ